MFYFSFYSTQFLLVSTANSLWSKVHDVLFFSNIDVPVAHHTMLMLNWPICVYSSLHRRLESSFFHGRAT